LDEEKVVSSHREPVDFPRLSREKRVVELVPTDDGSLPAPLLRSLRRVLDEDLPESFDSLTKNVSRGSSSSNKVDGEVA